MKKISVVMPVYGQWSLAKRNIDSLIHFDSDLISEIIVVDDCSPEVNPFTFDETMVKVIRNPSNLGYTGTVNSGLKIASSEIILLLDSDAYLIMPVVGAIIKMYDQDFELGCVGYRTVDDKGSETGSFCYEPTALGLILGQKLEYKIELLSIFKNRNILPYSCSVSFRKACINEMLYFDEQHFPVLDADLDLSMRIHRSKWKLLFNKNIIVSHSGGNSYKINYKRVLLYYKSRWVLLRKHKLVKYPILTKCLIKMRLKLELYILTIYGLFKHKDKLLMEKKNGRKLIVNEVLLYK